MSGISGSISSFLHAVAQNMLIPTMIILALLIVYSVFVIGAAFCEWLTEKRYNKMSVPKLINDMHDTAPEDIPMLVEKSALLKTQKGAVLTLAGNMGLSEDELYALAKSEVKSIHAHYQRRAARTNLLAKISPMLGLMGTLIPLGPGLVAMGNGDISSLSSSLTIAFDTTVAGLIASMICLVVTHLRRRWYKEYQDTLEAAVSCVLEKAKVARDEGTPMSHGYIDGPLCASDPESGIEAKPEAPKAQFEGGDL